MRRFISITLATIMVVLVMCLVACGKTPTPVTPDEPVITTDGTLYFKASEIDYDQFAALAKTKYYKSVTLYDDYYACVVSNETHNNERLAARVNIGNYIEELSAAVPAIARYRISDDFSLITIAVYDSKWDTKENGANALYLLRYASAMRYFLYGTEKTTVQIVDYTTDRVVSSLTIDR